MTIPTAHLQVLKTLASRDPDPRAAQGRLQRLYLQAVCRVLNTPSADQPGLHVFQDSTIPPIFTSVDETTGEFLSLSQTSTGSANLLRTGKLSSLESIVHSGQSTIKIF